MLSVKIGLIANFEANIKLKMFKKLLKMRVVKENKSSFMFNSNFLIKKCTKVLYILFGLTTKPNF